MHKGTLRSFVLVSSVDEKLQSIPKPWYPAVDSFRGGTIPIVVIFHSIWVIIMLKVLPDFLAMWGYNLLVTNSLYFAAFYSVLSSEDNPLGYISPLSFTHASNTYCKTTSCTKTSYNRLCIFRFAIVTMLCIHILCWESERFGVCMLMLFVGLSSAMVHEDRVEWGSVTVRTLKLGTAAGTISATTCGGHRIWT